MARTAKLLLGLACAASQIGPSLGRRGQQLPPGTSAAAPSPPYSVSVETLGTSMDARHQTVQVVVNFPGNAVASTYALFGDSDRSLSMPAAWHAPNGAYNANVGGVNPAFLRYYAAGAFDSWLTIAAPSAGGGASFVEPSLLAQLGLSSAFPQWSERQGLSSNNGMVFYTNPTLGPQGTTVYVAQLTVAAGTRYQGSFNLQGRSVGHAAGAPDWIVKGITFNEQTRPPLPTRPPPTPAPAATPTMRPTILICDNPPPTTVGHSDIRPLVNVAMPGTPRSCTATFQGEPGYVIRLQTQGLVLNREQLRVFEGAGTSRLQSQVQGTAGIYISRTQTVTVALASGTTLSASIDSVRRK